MRLCIFSRAFAPSIGGLERMSILLAEQASRAGHAVEVVTDTPDHEGAFSGGRDYAVLRTRSLGNRVEAFRRADVVLSMNVSLHGLAAAALAGTPVVAAHQGAYRPAGLVPSALAALKVFSTRFLTNIACSEFVAAQLPARSTVVPSAYDESVFTVEEAAPRRRDFVFSGRLVPEKGARVCLEAFVQVRRSHHDATLTLVGDGPEAAGLRELACTLDLADGVHFTGILQGRELAAKLREHACMLVPSLGWEGFGITALEGLACCDSVIVSRRGGLPEAVGACGLVVEPTVLDLGQAMSETLAARRGGLALPGMPSAEVRRDHLARHTSEAIARRYLHVLESVARGERQPIGAGD